MALRLLTQQVVGTSFSFYTEDEIRALSVKQITNPQTFDTFNRPTEGGVYDRALGPVDFNIVCPTCGLGEWRGALGGPGGSIGAAAAVAHAGAPRLSRSAAREPLPAAAPTLSPSHANCLRMMITNNMRFH